MKLGFKNVSYFNQIKNVTYSFKDKKITSIMGYDFTESLINLLLNIDKPTYGDVINSYDLRDIGYVYKNPSEYFLYDIVYNEISFNLKKYNYKLNKLDQRVIEALRIVGLSKDYLNRNIKSLSKSERFKVSLASILAINPKVIILDNPTIYLDNNDKKELISLLLRLKNNYNKTIIIISNDADFTYTISDNLVLFKKGKIYYYGKVNDIVKNTYKIIKSNFEVPKILEFIYLFNKKKNARLAYTLDINKLIKEVRSYGK